MKEKNKKILKGLGVGALACVGMFGLVGCSDVKIEQSDYDRIMSSVETVENSISDFEAATVYYNALNKIMNSSSDFWNNMKVETTISYTEEGNDYVEKNEMIMLKNGDENIAFWKGIGETDYFENNEYNIVYTQGDKLYEIDKEIDGFHKFERDGYFIDANYGLLFEYKLGYWNISNEIDFFKSSDIVSATQNKQGNYVITIIYRYVYTEFGHTGIESYTIHNEINENYNLISQTIEVESIDREFNIKGTVINKFSYGNVQYSDIQEEFEALINYEEE